MDIFLKEITKDNFEAVGELHIPDDQQEHLSLNIWSIAESKFYDSHHARAIYNEDKLIGFIMWVDVSDDKTSIFRFMVAHEFQNKGMGRLALAKAIEDIKNRHGLKTIEICYSPDNDIAKKLYFSSGFSEVGLSDCGVEAYAQIKLAGV